jgi:ribosomal protein S20
MIRAFDRLTQSIIQSLVLFNRKFNPSLAPDGDYDVIARGATSLMAKELRGMQADAMVSTLTPADEPYIDRKKLLSARLRARDMDDIMPPDTEIERRLAQQAQNAQQQQDQQNKMFEAQLRGALADAFKAITQGQKNTSSADAATVNSVMQLLEKGVMNGVVAPPQPDPAAGLAGPSGEAGPAPAADAPLSAGGPQPALAGAMGV